MVEQDRSAGLSKGLQVIDLRGRRWQQRLAQPGVEISFARTIGPDRIGDHRVSLPSWNEQMEQDRAPDVFLY